MARQATRTSCWCRGETGHSVVTEGYGAEAEATKACSAVMLIFGVAVAEEIASEEEDCGRAVSGGYVDREGRSCCYPFFKPYVLMETLFYQPDCCQFLFFKTVLSHFEFFIKVVVLDA